MIVSDSHRVCVAITMHAQRIFRRIIYKIPSFFVSINNGPICLNLIWTAISRQAYTVTEFHCQVISRRPGYCTEAPAIVLFPVRPWFEPVRVAICIIAGCACIRVLIGSVCGICICLLSLHGLSGLRVGYRAFICRDCISVCPDLRYTGVFYFTCPGIDVRDF